MTLAEIKQSHVLHHTATARGYISRKNPEGIATQYAGKYGKGFRVAKPNWDSTRFYIVEYWIIKGVWYDRAPIIWVLFYRCNYRSAIYFLLGDYMKTQLFENIEVGVLFFL